MRTIKKCIRQKYLVIIGFLLGVSVALQACAGKTKYNAKTIGSVEVCDIKGWDTEDILGLNFAGKPVSRDALLSKYGKSIKQVTDSNAHSKCPAESIPSTGRKLRVYLRMADDSSKLFMHEGYQVIYDLYFDDDDVLTTVIGRHPYVHDKTP